MNRPLFTLSLLVAPVLASASVPAVAKDMPGVARDPKGTVATPTPTAEQTLVKESLQRAGYSGVNSLQRGADGSWTGRAYKGPADVQVVVDPAGRVNETPIR